MYKCHPEGLRCLACSLQHYCYASFPSSFSLLEFVLTWLITYFSNLRSIILLCLPSTLHNRTELSKVFHSFMDKSDQHPLFSSIVPHASTKRGGKKPRSGIGNRSKKGAKQSGPPWPSEYKICHPLRSISGFYTPGFSFLLYFCLKKPGQQWLSKGTVPHTLEGVLKIPKMVSGYLNDWVMLCRQGPGMLGVLK